jgi:3',5'-cyclic AMP phosphodiesterase CpdA
VTIRIAHLSDTHFGGELKDAVDAAIDAVAAFEPTVVVVTGDLTLNGLPREFLAAKTWLGRFSQPLVVTPGNHDTPYWNIPLRALRPFDRFRRFIGPPDVDAFDAPGVVVRSLNSARGAQPRLDWSKGAVALDKLCAIHWGDDQALKVFVCHHPLIDIQGAPVSGGVRRGPRAAAILAEVGVDLVMTGHVHVPYVLRLGPAERGGYAIGAGTLSQRTRGAPPSFSTIVATPKAFVVTVQAWTGQRFEASDERVLARLPRPVD